MTKTVAVIFGGKSVEHDISIVTAISAVIKPLEASGEYVAVPVYISKNGEWYSDNKLKDIQLYSSGKIEDFLKTNKALQLSLGQSLTLIRPGIRAEKINIDIAFPAMHGAYGEDGSLMGLLRMAGIPFVGCDMDASVIAMDKVFAKQIAKASNIETPDALFFNKESFSTHKEEILQLAKNELTFPVFVKPAHLGSSIGISKVNSFKELENAMEVALHYDDKGLIEEAVDNLIEVTIPIIGNDRPRVALVEQPLTSSGDFFDFDTKYLKNGKKSGGKNSESSQGYSNLPAKISKDLRDKSIEVALGIYSAVGCKGIARIDLLIDEKSGKVYFNEINPLPGSLYAHNWRASGLSGVELVEKLIEYAEESFANKKKLETGFSTNFLKQSVV